MVEKLPITQYRNRLGPKEIECDSTRNLTPLTEIIGQERATKALHFGLNIDEKGFNIFVSGLHGTGRKSAVTKFIDELAKTKPKGSDWVYVNDFQNPYEPDAIRLPSGMGKELKGDMETFITEAKRFIPKVFESEDYINRRDETIKEIEEEKSKLFSHISEVAQEKGFMIQPGPSGLLTIPVKDDKPLEQEEFLSLPKEEQDAFQKRKEELMSELRSTFRKLRELDQKGTEAIEELNREVALNATGHRVAALGDKYEEYPEILAYIEAVRKDIVENLPHFMPQQQQQEQEKMPPQFQFQNMLLRELSFRKYEVNVIVDNDGVEGAPVVFEQNPTYQNLFGKIEKEVQYGVVTTDFTMIRPGAIHKANGGFLVFLAEDLFRNPYTWDGLKNALKSGEVIIEEPGERLGFITTKGIRPSPIPLDVKVVIIGTPMINHILYTQDPDFSELFKVKAEFDTTMDRDEENI
ncbi:MAG: ATP-binding protein, partial [Methanomicrobiaceae archaeon]|nr:ATP-binding protein [Methanomicrobiaceae archaeon]